MRFPENPVSPGRWYIGVCNYVQDPPSFDDTKRGKEGSGAHAPVDYAEYTVISPALFAFVVMFLLS
jgi:hypothetical protein